MYTLKKAVDSNCPACGKKLDLLAKEESNPDGFYICFDCREVRQIVMGLIRHQDKQELDKIGSSVLKNLPEDFFIHPIYSRFPVVAKQLYSFMLDVDEKTQENENYYDKDGRHYIILNIKKTAVLLGSTRNTIIKLKKALLKLNLISEVDIESTDEVRIYVNLMKS